MEPQELSLRDLLLQQPQLDVQAAVADLRQRIDQAVQQVDPTASVDVVLESDWLSIDCQPGSNDPQVHDALVAALYAAREDWYRDVLRSINAPDAGSGPA